MWMAELRKIVARNLAALMKNQNIVQAQLAKRSGVGQTTISKLLRGKASATIDTLEALAKALRVDVRDLMDPDMDPDVASDVNEARKYMIQSDAGGRKVVLAVAEREAGHRSRQRAVSDPDPPALNPE